MPIQAFRPERLCGYGMLMKMTLSVKTKLSALKLPAVVEKDGVRYKCDIVDDDQGIDLVLEKEEVEK